MYTLLKKKEREAPLFGELFFFPFLGEESFSLLKPRQGNHPPEVSSIHQAWCILTKLLLANWSCARTQLC
jgi:hypothetical protein